MKYKDPQKELAKYSPKDLRLHKIFKLFIENKDVNENLQVNFRSMLLEDPELKEDHLKKLIPFLGMSDGGYVAFWVLEDSLPIVYFDTEGGQGVCANSFEEFLARIPLKNTQVSDIDSPYQELNIDNIKLVNSEVNSIEELDKQFQDWYEEGSLLLKPFESEETEEIRKEIYSITVKMLEDGLDKLHTTESNWWSFDFRVDVKFGKTHIEYVDYGEWYSVPKQYKLVNEVEKLKPFFKSKNLKEFEFVVTKAGTVSVNHDRELLLVER